MAASINEGSLLQHCQIETIERSSSAGRGAQIGFGTGAHEPTQKRGSCSSLVDLIVMKFNLEANS
jgi:hypothetical protein